jgi:hypothetical protein
MGREVLEKVERQKASATQFHRTSNSRNGLSSSKLLPSTIGDDLVINYTAPKYVSDVIAALGRTEDVKFSPNNRRLAVVSFLKNKIAVFDLCITASPYETKIALTDVVEISSAYLKSPHGVDFIDDEKIIVANRGGDATIFGLPCGELNKKYELVPLQVIPSGDVLVSPGNVSITRKDQDLYEALICNNYRGQVTRHLIDFTEGCSIKSSDILLKKWLHLPDGISVNAQWIAISNHDSHNVLLYENTSSLHEGSDPCGVLRCVRYPHGLRFTSDGSFILVADSAAPYVHIYRKDESGWRGVRKPLKSFRVLKDEDFLRGRTTEPASGGPKGLDIDNSMRTFVTTCEGQPLAFFDLAGIFERISLAEGNWGLPGSGETVDADQRTLEINYELDSIPCYSQDELKNEIRQLKNSRSWRITAPYRKIGALLSSAIPARL